MDEKDLLDVINKLRTTGREWKQIDAKQDLALKEMGQKAEFTKDVIAMANNGERSFIVVGLQDKTFLDVGPLRQHHTKNDLNQILIDKIDPPIVVDYQEFTISGNEYGLVEIVGINPPYIVARDIVSNPTDTKKVRLDKGTILVRHDDRTEGISRSELEEMLRLRGIRRGFENETRQAQDLVFNRPRFWEHKLTIELLRTSLLPIRQQFDDLKRGLIYKKATLIKGLAFLDWANAKSKDLLALVQLLTIMLTEEVMASWGPPGVEGNPLEIKGVVDKVASACRELIEWETEVHFVVTSSAFEPAKEKMAGWTAQIFDEVCSVPDKLEEPFKQADPSGTYNINLVFKEMPGLQEFLQELEELKKHPERWNF